MASLRDLAYAQPVQSSLRQASLLSGATPEQAYADAASLNNPFEAGAKSAIRSSIGGLKAAAAGVQDAFGYNPDDMYAAAAEDARQAQILAPQVHSLGDIHDFGDALAYGAGQVGTMAPFLALGGAGGLAGRGLNAALRGGMTGAQATHAGAMAAFTPTMAGEQMAQMHEIAPEMGPGERLLRGLAVGGAQAVAGAAVPARLFSAPAAGSFASGMGKQLASGAAGMAAMDVIGQGHRTTYDPTYQFDPAQTGEAAVAGAVGMAPYAVPHAVMGSTGNLGAKAAGLAKDGAAAGLDQITQAAKAVGGAAYDAMPEAAQSALKTVVSTGKMTKEAADALYPHVDNLGSAIGDVVKNFYADTKQNIGEYRDDASLGLPTKAEDVVTDLAANLATAGQQAKKEAKYAADQFVSDPEVAAIAGPAKELLGKAKNRLDGVTKVAEIMSDPAKWLKEGENMDADKLKLIDTAMKTPHKAKQFANEVLGLLDEVPMDSPSAREVRQLAERTKAGEDLSDNDKLRMYTQFRLASKAHRTADDLAQVLKFDERLKAGQQATGEVAPTQFSKQKTKAAEDQWAKDLAARTSESFRNRVEQHVNEMFGSSEVGRQLLERDGGAQKEIDGFVDFMSNVAAGKKGYDAKAARSFASTVTTHFGEAGHAAIDAIIRAADNEFTGRMGSKEANRIAALRDEVSSMYTDAAAIRPLLKNKEADLHDLSKDIETVMDMDGKREKYEAAISALRNRASRETDPERRFEMMEQASEAADQLESMGLDGLRSKWVNEGIVEPKKFDKLVELVKKFGGHEDQLAKPERRRGANSTEANHASEKLGKDGRDIAPEDAEAVEFKDNTEDADARPGKEMSEADEIAASRRAEQGNDGEQDRVPPIWFGTNAFESGGHKSAKIGAPLSRHPSGDYGYGDKPGAQYNAALEEAHAKYGHRVTKAHGVRPLAWAEEMANTEGKKTEYGYLDDALQALLKEDQRRLKNEKLTAEDKKYIGDRAAMAEKLYAQQAERGGLDRFPAAGHFFAHNMNRNYRYYRMEQHDASNLSYSADQLRAAYSVREGETANTLAERESARDGGVFNLKVYKNSLLPVKDADGKMIQVDVAKLVTNAMKHHQAADITGVGEKNVEVNFAQEILTAFHNVVASLMTADGIHKEDPLGALLGEGRVDGQHFDPNLVVFRDPTGRVLQELGENVKVTSVRNHFTLGDLMGTKGIDPETGRLQKGVADTKLVVKIDGKDVGQVPESPGAFNQRDIDSVLAKVGQSHAKEEGRRDAKSREAGYETGKAHRAVTIDGVQKTLDVRALLSRMLERNGMEPQEALYKGDLPKATAGMLLREAFNELKAMGFDGNIFDMAKTQFDGLVVYRQERMIDGEKTMLPVTLKDLKSTISNEQAATPRNLRDAKLHEALAMLREASGEEMSSYARVGREAARDADTSPEKIAKRAEAVERGVRQTTDKGDIDSIKTPANKYAASEIDNFRLGSLLREFGEMSNGDAPLFDRSANQIFLDASQSLSKPRGELSEADVKAIKEEIAKHLGEQAELKAPLKPAPLEMKTEITGEALSTKNEQPKALPLWQQRLNAKTESKDVQTNEPNLLAAAKAQREEAVAKSKAARAEQIELGRINASRDRLDAAPDKMEPATEAEVAAYGAKKLPAKETAPAKASGGKDFDAFKKADEFAASEPKTGRETVDLVKTLSDEQLRDFSLALPRLSNVAGKTAAQAYRVLGADDGFGMSTMKDWAKQQRDRAGIRFNERTGKFEEVAPVDGDSPGTPAFSKQATGGKDMFAGELKEGLRAELTRLTKDALKLEVPDTMGKDISGSYLDKLLKVSAEASDPLGTLHHEAWHGIEQLLGEMGEHGKAVLDTIYKHVDSPLMKEWLKTQYAGDEGVQSQLGTASERTAFAFQKFMQGEKMPLNPETRTKWEAVKEFIAKVAAKLGFETTTTEERAENFFDYVKKGDFARDIENAPAVRRGLGEKNGDNLMHTVAKNMKPVVEGFEKVFQHSDVRIRKLGIKEYDDVLELYSGVNGKGGYGLEIGRYQNKFANDIGALMAGMAKEEQHKFMSSDGMTQFRGRMEAYMKKAGVGDEQISRLYDRLDTFNGERIADNIEEFITDLVQHGGFKGKAGEARKIASQIADKGYFFDGETKLFENREDIKDKWLERDPGERVKRFIERATYTAEQTRAFGDKDGMRGKLDKLLAAGDAKADADGRKLVRDFGLAMEGRLGEGTISPGMKKLMGAALFANNVHILPLAVFSQMLDPMNMAMRRNKMSGSLDALWRGVSDMPRSFDAMDKNHKKDYWENLANEIGSAPSRIVTNVMSNLMNGMHIGGKIGEANETFFKYNFMDQWNRSMHVEATKHAVEFLREHTQDQNNHSERFLKELGLTKEDVKFNKAGELELNDKTERAIVQYVEEAMAHPDATSNPMWMNDPRFALLSQMKRFTFAHAKYILGRGMSELKQGNSFPIAPALIAMPWMMAADGMRDTLTGSEGYQSKSLGDATLHAMERAGHLGRGQFGMDIENAIGRGQSPVEAFGGPTVEMFGNIARGAHNGHMLDAMLDYVPGGALVAP